jgi:hypothetical protein
MTSMIDGLKHQYTDDWLARWRGIAKGLHWLSVGLVLAALPLASFGWHWSIGAWAAAFVVRAAWERAYDHIEARMAASIAELNAHLAELEKASAQ